MCIRDSDLDELVPDMLVSFGYRYLLDRSALEYVSGNAVNLHISLLPWGRGADPNLWSWLEHTPKGVSVHWMDEQLDKGDLVAQRELELDHSLNLSQTYATLQNAVAALFSECWRELELGSGARFPQARLPGTYHRAGEKNDHTGAIPSGWRTPCYVVEEYGRRNGLWVKS